MNDTERFYFVCLAIVALFLLYKFSVAQARVSWLEDVNKQTNAFYNGQAGSYAENMKECRRQNDGWMNITAKCFAGFVVCKVQLSMLNETAAEPNVPSINASCSPHWEPFVDSDNYVKYRSVGCLKSLKRNS